MKTSGAPPRALDDSDPIICIGPIEVSQPPRFVVICYTSGERGDSGQNVIAGL